MDSAVGERSPEKKELSTTRKPQHPKGTRQNIVIFLVRNVAPILIACLVAFIFRYFSSSSNTSTIEKIPISRVLSHNLRVAKTSWEHGVLTHALLELQNPELTVFAGPGYGFNLHGSSNLEAFPDGRLPKCASEGGGSSWGRYDKWTNVKGLRYAAEKIDIEGKWLFDGGEGGSAADTASLGWAALLLERAGATDPMIPVEARRNLFGEAADKMVRYLIEENPKFLVSSDGSDTETEHDLHAPLRKFGETSGRKWAISHQSRSKQLWADSIFMVPPFLAAYAVARQNETWVREAVEQIRTYREVLSVSAWGDEASSASERDELWKHIVSQSKLLEGVCCRDEGLWLTGNAWALAGIVRVFGVLDKWKFSGESAKSAKMSSKGETRDELKTSIRQVALALIRGLHSQQLTEDGLLPNYLTPVDTEHSQWIFGDAAGTALVVSSVYRAAQLGLINGQKELLLSWADGRYNAVARKIHPKGLVEDVANVIGVPAKEAVVGTSEAQSFVVMMFAARRDCVKLKVCP